jgi:Zn-dependent oligopeptidase
MRKSITALEALQQLDQVSRTFTTVADIANMCRMLHVSEEWKSAAGAAFETVSEHMAQINVDASVASLFAWLRPLQSTLPLPAQLLFRSLDSPLMHRSEQLSTLGREHAASLQTETAQLSHSLFQAIHDHHVPVSVNAGEMQVLRSILPPSAFSRKGTVSSQYSTTVLTYCTSELVRKKFYRAMNDASAQGAMDILMNLLQKRMNLANLLGFDSYAEYATQATVAQTPETVQEVLDAMRVQYRGTGAWNEIYESRAKSQEIGLDFDADRMVKGALQSIQHLFGVTFTSQRTIPGEVWVSDESVFKYTVHSADGRCLGNVYLDLFDREGKDNMPASMTISSSPLGDEKPSYVLCLSLSRSKRVSFRAMMNFLHELGHIMQGLHSQGQYYSPSGFRGPLDFLEIPSTFLEYLAFFPEVVRTMVEPVFADAVEPFCLHLLDLVYSELAQQTLYARVDQAFHSITAQLPLTSAQQLEHLFVGALAKTGMSIDVETRNAFCRLSHLGLYGASYYSYPFAHLFVSGFFNRLAAVPDCEKRPLLHRVQQYLFTSCGVRTMENALQHTFARTIPEATSTEEFFNRMRDNVRSTALVGTSKGTN